MRRILLVDFSNILYRAVFGNALLSYRGTFTGGVYGFLQIVGSLASANQCDSIMVADDAKPYHRLAHFDAYKSGRTSASNTREDYVEMVSVAKKQIRELCKLLALPIQYQKGYEADDLIAWAVRNTKSDCFIASNDSDLYQLLLSSRVVICKSKGELYTREHFILEYGVMARQWPRVLSLSGSHNGVPGIRGVGLKTAASLVRQGCTDDHIWTKYKLSTKERELKEKLSTYPWEGTEAPIKPFKFSKLRLDRRELQSYLDDKYGIELAPYMYSGLAGMAK